MLPNSTPSLPTDLPDVASWRSAAAAFPEPFRLIVRTRCASTNDELRRLADDGAPHGTVLVAYEQTSGRGRRGAAWHSVPGESLAFSILLRPNEPMALWPRLSLAAGLAVAEAAEDLGIRAQIKWPNDIWIGRRKAAGILVEAGSGFTIVGIGININASEFPAALADSATSMKLELGMETSLQDWLVAVIDHVALRHGQIGSGFPTLLQGVRQRCALVGHAIVLNTAGRKVSGTVVGIDDAGALVLDTSEGRLTVIQADEVRMID
jgi:BirA family biotin operon repressor/biotin-[acetyl-CoA-carboxylase] ligase